MIQITAQTRILVAVEAVDFRKGIDGLARVCQERLQSDPFCGWLAKTKVLEAHEFYVLLAGGDPASARGAPAWRQVSMPG